MTSPLTEAPSGNAAPARAVPDRRGPIHRVLIASALALTLSACAGDAVTRQQERVVQDPSAMMRIAAAAETSGDPAGAMAFYRRAATLQPESSAAQIGIARSLAAQGDIIQAIEVLRVAQKQDAFDAEVCSALGRLLVAARRPDEALVTFEEGLNHDPQSVPMLIGQGVSLDSAGRHDAAQASYRKVLEIDPGNQAARKDLALSLSLNGRKTSS
jgi:Flp pilus assembly protein TadD